MAQKILIIDDSKTARREIKKIVSTAQKKVFEADNGRWGLELLGNIGECSLIFCDMTMPEMNGLEFLNAIRADARFAQIPVVMMTSDTNLDHRKAFESLNVTAWLQKPIAVPVVKELLQKHGKEA